MTKKDRFQRFIAYFEKHMPDPGTELRYAKPYEFLVATILSAQCTDKRVNLTTPALFKKFPAPDSLAKAKTEEVYGLIKSVSYPNNKTKHLIGMGKMVMDEFNGEIPTDTDNLQKLPGVGRKTAHVIASVLFGQPKLAVDTHVFRVSDRIGLTTNAKNPLQTELQLIKFIPENKIAKAHHWLLLHGRYICKSRKPNCHECKLTGFCKYYIQNVITAENKILY